MIQLQERKFLTQIYGCVHVVCYIIYDARISNRIFNGLLNKNLLSLSNTFFSINVYLNTAEANIQM